MPNKKVYSGIISGWPKSLFRCFYMILWIDSVLALWIAILWIDSVMECKIKKKSIEKVKTSHWVDIFLSIFNRTF